MNSKSPTRIGMVNFINTAPLYEVWKRTVRHPEWQVVEAVPAQLNRMLYNNDLDMGLVSSHEYAAHPDQYMILDDISISASGPVGSVFLFSTCEPTELDGKLIVLSGQSQTSVSLVKIILEEFYRVSPHYQIGKALEAHQDHDNVSGVLAIGDEALLLAQSTKYQYRLDLSEVWYEQTALPFVFAVWAIRQEFCEKYPDKVRKVQGELKRCVEQGKNELGSICSKVSARVSMSPDACYRYLCGIEYDLGPQKKKSLERFIDYLIAREQTKSSALPLKIFMQSPEEKKKFVRDKFAAISNKYDLLNSVLSMQVDRYWRWVTTRELREYPDGSILDLCAGTLPLSLELTRQAPDRKVLAVDFCEDMLRSGVDNMPDDNRKSRIAAVCGDGEDIPAVNESVWGVTVAFGVRNLARTEQGIAEMWRVLKPGGKLLILEFSRPRNPIFKPIYNFYLNRILPKVAGLISGDKEAYEYLASSIAEFYEPEELLSMMRRAGFVKYYCRPLTMGIVTIYVGVK